MNPLEYARIKFQCYSAFVESQHPRDDEGKFTETESREKEVKKTVKQTVGKKVLTQKRAKHNEVGPNGETYRGGAFIATTDLPKKLKDNLAKSATGKVRVGMSGWEVPEPGKMSIVDKLGGTVMNPRNGEINYQYLNWRGATDSEIKDYEELSKRHLAGEKWASTDEFPHLANLTDAARLYVAGKEIPDSIINRLPDEYRTRLLAAKQK